MNYQQETDRMLSILEQFDKDKRPLAELSDSDEFKMTNEFYYILGSMPIEEQEAFIGLIVSTGYVSVEGVERFKEYRRKVDSYDERMSIKSRMKEALAGTEDTAERAHVSARIRLVATEKSRAGDCPPEDLRPPGVCDPDVDCRACWIEKMTIFMTPQQQGEQKDA